MLSGMGISNFKKSLEQRYSALTGELQVVHASIARIRREAEKLPELEARIPQLENLISGAELLLRDAHPDWNPEQAPPIQPWTHTLPVPFGSCGRRGMNILRNTSEPMTAREIAMQVLREVGCENPDQKLAQRTVNAVEASLRHHRGKTVESSGRYPMQWRAINKPEIEFGP